MAAAPKLDNWEEKKNQVSDAQLKHLEKVAANLDTGAISPDKVLEEAEGVMVITTETRARINTVMGPSHILLFQRALAVEKKLATARKETNNAAAFIRAFEHVYGRFMLEQGPKMKKDAAGNILKDKDGVEIMEDDELEHKDGDLMKALDKVLKFKVVPGFGLKGRSELQAVVRRLREVEAAKGVGVTKTAEIAALEVKKAQIEANLPTLQKDADDFRAVSGSISKIGGLNTGGGLSNLDQLFSSLNNINSLKIELVDFQNTMAANSLGIENQKKFDKLVTRLSSFKIDSKADLEDWKQFLEKELYPFLKKLKPLKLNFIEASNPSKKIIQLTTNAKITRIKTLCDTLKVDIGKTVIDTTVDDLLQSSIAQFTGVEANVNDLKTKISALKKPENDVLIAAITAACDEYLTKYAALKMVAPADLATAVETFTKEYRAFVQKINNLFAGPNTAVNKELLKAKGLLGDYERDDARLKAYKSPSLTLKSILESAFGMQLSPDEMKKREDKNHHAEHKKTALDEDKKYFGGEDVKGVNKRYNELLDDKSVASTATAESVREKQAALNKHKENEKKLGEVKELFTEKKIGELQSKFLKLKGISKKYEESTRDDIDQLISKQNAEVAMRKSAADNSRDVEKNLKNRISLSETQKSALKAGDPQIAILDSSISKLESDVTANKILIDASEAAFVTASAESARLVGLKEKRDEFVKLIKEFREEVLEYCRGCEKAIGQNIFGGPSTADEIGKLKQFFNGLSVDSTIEISTFSDMCVRYESLARNFEGLHKAADEKMKEKNFGVNEQRDFNTENGKLEKAKKFFEELEPIVAKLVKAEHHGVILKTGKIDPAVTPPQTQEQADKKASEQAAHEMENEYARLKKVDAVDFSVAEVAKFYKDHLAPILDPHHGLDKLKLNINAAITVAEKDIKTTARELTDAKEGAERSKNLTDAQAARKIIGVLVAEQFPELSLLDQERIAKMLLAGDVGKLLNEEGYEALARHGSPEVLKNAEMVGIRARLIGFKYKEGDKIVHPFEGLKPDNFKDWSRIKNLFDIKKLNYKNGFILLAALEIFDEERTGEMENVVSIQLAGTQKKMKELLAEQLGVKDRMDEAGVRKIVDDAFKAQMEKIRPMVRTHFENNDKNAKGYKEASQNKIDLLNLEYEELQYKYRTGEIDGEIYDIKLKGLVKKAEEADVLEDVKFSQATVASKFWNHKDAQWLRDKGINFGKLVGSKLGRAAWGATLGTGRGALNVVGKLGLRGSSLGLGIAKYPAAALAGIGSGVLSIFRKGSWTENVKADVGRVYGGVTGVQDSLKATSKGLKVVSHVGHHVKTEWAKPKLDTKKYEEKDRVKRAKNLRAERMKLHAEKSEVKPLEITESPFIDLAEFKAKVTNLDKILGTSTTFPDNKDVKAGTEKKEEHPKDDHPKEEKHEKKDDHAHPPAHH